MRKSYRSSSISREGLKAGILLAHNTQRCERPSQEMQDLSRACQDLTPPIRALDINHKPLAFLTMRFAHTGTSAHWEGPMQIHHRRSGLLHQVGRSRTFGHNHRTEDMQFCVANHHMQVWYPKSLGIRQWKAI